MPCDWNCEVNAARPSTLAQGGGRDRKGRSSAMNAGFESLTNDSPIRGSSLSAGEVQGLPFYSPR